MTDLIRMTKADRKEIQKIADLDFRRSDDRARLARIWPDFVAGGKTAAGFRAVKEHRAFDAFAKADCGIYNGFDFVGIFHKVFRKSDAVAVLESDDCADVDFNGKKYHVGIDGVTVYFMSKNPTKRVDFNRSVYFF